MDSARTATGTGPVNETPTPSNRFTRLSVEGQTLPSVSFCNGSDRFCNNASLETLGTDSFRYWWAATRSNPKIVTANRS